MNWRGGQPYCKKRGKINKTAVSAAVGCGMIRVDPDMLRSVRAYCVLTSFCREKERTHFVWKKENALLCGRHTKAKCLSNCFNSPAGRTALGSFTMTDRSFSHGFCYMIQKNPPFSGHIVTFQLTKCFFYTQYIHEKGLLRKGRRQLNFTIMVIYCRLYVVIII